MDKKTLLLIFGIFILVGTFGVVSAGNYVFENTTNAELMKIWGENGNISIFGNVTAQNFLGTWNGSASFVPYTGAKSNLVLGANNFSVDNSVLFVDSENNNVGIGTTTPQNKLNVVGTANVTSNMTISGMTIYQDGEDMVFRV